MSANSLEASPPLFFSPAGMLASYLPCTAAQSLSQCWHPAPIIKWTEREKFNRNVPRMLGLQLPQSSQERKVHIAQSSRWPWAPVALMLLPGNLFFYLQAWTREWSWSNLYMCQCHLPLRPRDAGGRNIGVTWSLIQCNLYFCFFLPNFLLLFTFWSSLTVRCIPSRIFSFIEWTQSAVCSLHLTKNWSTIDNGWNILNHDFFIIA